MSLQDVVAQTGRVLADTYSMFGPAPASPAFTSPEPPQAPQPSWSGEGGSTHSAVAEAQTASLTNIAAADQHATAAASQVASAAADGRAGMSRIITATQNDVAALAPAASTPAGQTELVETLRKHLRHTKALIRAAQRRNQRIAAQMRGVSYGGGIPPMSGAMGTPPGEPFAQPRRVHHGRLASRAVYSAARQSGFSPNGATAVTAAAVNLSPNASKAEMQAYASSQLAKHGWGQNEMLPLKTLWDHESSWDPHAHNASGASGMAQFMPYCADPETQILTSAGWKTYDEVRAGDLVLTLNHLSGLSEWEPVETVNVFDVIDEPMLSFESATHSSLTTRNHRWPVLREWQRGNRRGWATSETLTRNERIPIAAECADLPAEPKYTDAFVEVVGWSWTEGTYHKPPNDNIKITQSAVVNARNCERIRAALTSLAGPSVQRLDYSGMQWREYVEDSNTRFFLGATLSRTIKAVAPSRVPTFEFLRSLTRAQLLLFIDVSLAADGCGSVLTQKNPRAAEAFQFACILAGHATSIRTVATPTSSTRKYGYDMTAVNLRSTRATSPLSQRAAPIIYTGQVWCPSTGNRTWLARRRGTVYFTGNTAPYYASGNENQPWWCQIDQGLQYIADRYGSPSAAWAQYFNHAGGEGSY